MRKPMNIDFERCTSGIEFEEWVKELLGQLRMKAERVEHDQAVLYSMQVLQQASWERTNPRDICWDSPSQGLW